MSFLFATKMVFLRSLKSTKSGSEAVYLPSKRRFGLVVWWCLRRWIPFTLYKNQAFESPVHQIGVALSKLNAAPCESGLISLLVCLSVLDAPRKAVALWVVPAHSKTRVQRKNCSSQVREPLHPSDQAYRDTRRGFSASYCGWTKSISHHLRNPKMMITL